jgi:hypothetical protein
MASCEVCKQQMPDDALFCPHCGYSAKLRRTAGETKPPTSTTTLNRAAIKVASSHSSMLIFVSKAFKVLAVVYFVVGSIAVTIAVTRATSSPFLNISTDRGFGAWVHLEVVVLLTSITIAFFGYVLSLLMEIADNTSR